MAGAREVIIRLEGRQNKGRENKCMKESVKVTDKEFVKMSEKDPVKITDKEPVKRPDKEPVKEAVKRPDKESVKRPDKEPLKRPDKAVSPQEEETEFSKVFAQLRGQARVD